MSYTNSTSLCFAPAGKSHASAKYALPADGHTEEEKDRLNFQHRLLTRLFGDRLIFVPVNLEAGDSVLDCGTGTGCWLIDLAHQVPKGVHLNGIDIESRFFPQADDLSLTENVNFCVGSTLDLPPDWASKYKLMNQRLMVAAFSLPQYKRNLGELYRTLAPGGWLQLVELNCLRPKDPELPNFHKLLTITYDKMFMDRGLVLDLENKLPPILNELGFVNIDVEEVMLPIGKWGGLNGEEISRNWVGAYRAMKVPVVKGGWIGSGEEWDELIANAAREWDEKPGVKFFFYILRAQKPS